MVAASLAFKPGGSPTLSEAYRLLSIMQWLVRGFERTRHRQLRPWVESWAPVGFYN